MTHSSIVEIGLTQISSQGLLVITIESTQLAALLLAT